MNIMREKGDKAIKILTILAIIVIVLCVCLMIRNNLTGFVLLPTSIDSCQEISIAGEYILSQNITDSSACLNITSDDIILDCQGHSITGTGSSYGIKVYGEMNGVIISNCVIRDFYKGIDLNGTNTSIFSNIIKNNTYGIYITGIDNLIYNNYLDNTNNGFALFQNRWNTSLYEDTNIINGLYIGGNYYSDYSSIDSDNNGIGNINYNISAGNTDSLPLTITDCYDSEANPIPICTCSDLSRIRENLTGNYELQNNMGCSGFDYGDGNGFMPIGDDNNRFNGTLNGKGHKIIGLFISRIFLNNSGLFGSIDAGAYVRNISLTNAHIYGNNLVGGLTGDNYGNIFYSSVTGGVVQNKTGNAVGGLVGRNSGNIYNSYSKSTIIGNLLVGGLVGYNDRGRIGNCYSTGTVSSTDMFVGGLVGYSDAGIIGNSYSTGRVNSISDYAGGLVGEDSGKIYSSYSTGIMNSSGDYVGGLVGYSVGTINTSYSAGDVYGKNYVGGLVGYVNSGKVTDSYSTGNVNGSNYVGGLVGENDGGLINNTYAKGNITISLTGSGAGLVAFNYGGEIANSYSIGRGTGSINHKGLVWINNGTCSSSFWDIEASGQDKSACGEGKTTEEMKARATFTDFGWDFCCESANGIKESWDINNTIIYPELRWQSSGYNCEILQECRELSTDNRMYTLVENIDSSETCFPITGTNITLEGYGRIINYSQSTGNQTGIHVYSDNVTVRNFVLIQENSLSSESGGISVAGNLANIQNNRIFVSGINCYGIKLAGGNAYVSGNEINSCTGIRVMSSSNTLLVNNVTTSDGTGILLTGNSDANSIEGNSITTGDYPAIHFQAEDYFQESNRLISNNINSSSSNAFYIENGRTNRTYLIDEDIHNYSINSSIVYFASNGRGEIRFLEPISGSGTDLSSDVKITSNSIYVNTAEIPGFNKPANVIFYGVTYVTPGVEADLKDDGIFERCDSEDEICKSPHYSDGTFTFKADHFTTFRLIETYSPTPVTSGGGGGGGGGCSDQCRLGFEEKECADSNSLKKRTCGNYDSDSCLELSTWNYIVCRTNQECIKGICAERKQECTPDWECTKWEECTEGMQVRSCKKTNDCNIDQGRPEESRVCQKIVGRMKLATLLLATGVFIMTIALIILILRRQSSKRR